MGGERAGANRIEKILSGCALLEHWVGARGSRGKSLFYRVPSEDAWKQVWVTENPSRPGGVKEKTLDLRPFGSRRSGVNGSEQLR